MKILVADDHEILREGLKQALKANFPMAEIVEVDNFFDLQQLGSNHKWDIIFTDVSMPENVAGKAMPANNAVCKAIKTLKLNAPETPIIVLTMHPPQEYAPNLFKLGIAAYLTKDAPISELEIALVKVLKGKRYVSDHVAEVLADRIQINDHNEKLSSRDLEILELMATGKTSLEIADITSLSPSTISTYKFRIKKKIGINSTEKLIQYALTKSKVEILY